MLVGVVTEVAAQAGEPSGFSRVAGPVMTRATNRANAQDLARLKALLQDGSGAPR